jgi:hypothetical protein
MEVMTKMISKCQVMELQRVSTYDQLTKNEPAHEDILFKKGKISNAAALVLSGKVGILAGKELFHSELGAWSMIGADALHSHDGTYIPDFTAYVTSETVRVLWITKTDINTIFNDGVREISSVEFVREEKRKRRLANQATLLGTSHLPTHGGTMNPLLVCPPPLPPSSLLLLISTLVCFSSVCSSQSKNQSPVLLLTVLCDQVKDQMKTVVVFEQSLKAGTRMNIWMSISEARRREGRRSEHLVLPSLLFLRVRGGGSGWRGPYLINKGV